MTRTEEGALQVTLEGRKVGLLRRFSTRQMAFLYEESWLSSRHAVRFPMSAVEATLNDLKKRLPDALNNAVKENPSTVPAQVYDPICEAATRRLRRL